MKRLRPFFILVAVLFSIVFLFFSWKNSLVITGISIRVKAGVAEHFDHVLVGFGSENRLPDYKIKLRVNGKIMAIDLGTKLNTSATNWVDFSVNDIVPVRKLQEVLVIEDDKVANDTLDRIQPSGESFEGSEFQVKLTTARSFDAGLNWFFNTPPGKAVSTGIIIGIVLVIASFF